MDTETIQQAWAWLLSLSKTQLILLGGMVALLVAVSRILRFLFLLGALVVFLVMFFPEIGRRYQESPLPAMLEGLMRKGNEATQDPVPTQPEPK